MKKWILEHSYVIPVLYFIVYMVAFTSLERFIEPKYIIHCSLDDKIPFCEWFFIPYALWFVMVPITLFIYMIKDKKYYLKLCTLMFGGMTFCLCMYFLFPNGLELRQAMPNDNILCRLVQKIYDTDTATNVCPSIHVSSTIAILYINMKSDYLKNNTPVKVISWIVAVLICISTVTLKQHSVIDVAAGILVTMGIGRIIFREENEPEKKYWPAPADNR